MRLATILSVLGALTCVLAAFAGSAPLLTAAAIDKIRVDHTALEAESENLDKEMRSLLKSHADNFKLETVYGAEVSQLSFADRSLLEKYEATKIVVAARRAEVSAIQTALEKLGKPATTQPSKLEDEVRRLRSEVLRLSWENARLAAAGEKKPDPVRQVPGENFVYSKPSLQAGGILPSVIGEITNSSGKDFKMAMFKMSFYDKDETLIGTADIIISNFANGQRKSYDATIGDHVDTGKIDRYKIQFENGI